MSPGMVKPPMGQSPALRAAEGEAKSDAALAAANARFRAEMPKIPGVAGGGGPQTRSQQRVMRIAQIVAAVVVLSCVGGWWLLRGTHAGAQGAGEPSVAPTPSPAPAELPPPPVSAAAPGRNEIGTVEEFARPWTTKKFQYTSILNSEPVPAIAIRLPVGDGRSAVSYWGVLLKAPFGNCELEFISDLDQIKTRFGYRATHPMIVDSCAGIIYDPLRTGTLPDGTWSRGDIVMGSGLRPPLQVEIKIEGGHLFAGRGE